MLLAECERGRGVEICLNARGVAIELSAGEFRVVCSAGEFAAGALVVATGGLSIPKMGATGLAYDLARQFGLKVTQTRPALVPLLLAGAEKIWTELAGVSTDVTAQANRGPKFREKLLITHRGLSGPAVLQASSYWQPGETIQVDLAPAVDGVSKLVRPLLQTAHGGMPWRSTRCCAILCRNGWPLTWPKWALQRAGRMRLLKRPSAS